jgi:hypothetical protein
LETPIIVAIITGIVAITVSVIAFIREVRMKKLQAQIEEERLQSREREEEAEERSLKLGALDRLLDFQSFNEIRDSVDRMFASTKADRFMIIIAMNGQTDFRVVSVIFEQHQNRKYKVNAIIRYRDVEIDDNFRQNLKRVEVEGSLTFDVKTMKPQLLKDFYVIEKVKHAKLRFLHRQSLDDRNDVVVYSSIATHEDEPFTHIEETIIKTEYEGSIKHTMQTYI